MTEANVFYTAAERFALVRTIAELDYRGWRLTEIDDGDGREPAEGLSHVEAMIKANQVEECRLHFTNDVDGTARTGSFLVVWGNSAAELIANFTEGLSSALDSTWDMFVEDRPGSVKEIVEGMKRLRKDGPTISYQGICSNLDDRLDPYELGVSLYTVVRQLAAGWPKHSGAFCYPVPDPDGGVSEADWGRDTQQGRDRWELLDWIIERAEESL